MTPADAGRTDAPLPAALAPLAAAPSSSALFLDFDGTLAGIVADPRDAQPLPGVPALLADLAATFAVVAVISGRPTSFLAEVLDSPPGVTLAGLYGLERALRGPDHDAWAEVIDQVVDEANATAPTGVYVEPKGLTVTLHWRRAQQHKDWVIDFAEQASARHRLMVHTGRHERELRPPVEVDKGTVVRALAEEHADRLRAVAVFGDDVGDLPAFAAVDDLVARDGSALTAVKVAAVDIESPAEVARAADLTVEGAAGAVAMLATLQAAASAAA